MSEPLTDAEVAALRAAHEPLGSVLTDHIALCDRCTDEAMCSDAVALRVARNALPRLLDELALLRRRDREQAAGEEVLRQQLRDAERKIEMLRGG